MFDFSDPAAMAQWEVFTDRTLGLGGTSTAQLARCPDYEVIRVVVGDINAQCIVNNVVVMLFVVMSVV